MTLIGLLVGMTVAAILACVVIAALARTGVALQTHRQRTRAIDDAWMALDAIVRDMDAGSMWQVCTEARDCPAHAMLDDTPQRAVGTGGKTATARARHAAYRMAMLFTEQAEWLVSDGLRRCAPMCLTYLDDVVSMTLTADVRRQDGSIRRAPYIQFDGARPDVVEVTLTTKRGDTVSRVVRRRKVGVTVPAEGPMAAAGAAR